MNDPTSWKPEKGSGSIWVGHPAIARFIVRFLKLFEPTEVYCELVNPIGYVPEREIIGRVQYRWRWLAIWRCPRSCKIDRTLVLYKIRPSTAGGES